VTELIGETDAMVWAQEFVQVVKGRPDLLLDEGFMVGWFANAIESGRMEEERVRSNDLTAATLLLKDLLHPNETKEAAEERAQLFLDAQEAKEA